MTTSTEKHHPNHPHKHGPDCGHTAIRHDGHVDYLHGNNHLHHIHEDHVTTNMSSRSTPKSRALHASNPLLTQARPKLRTQIGTAW